MEDGFDLVREFLRPQLTAAAAEFETPPVLLRDFETILLQNLQRSVALGARDVELRVERETETGVFTMVELSDTAPGLSLTRLRRWLSDGAFSEESEKDWTRPPCPPPIGPAGFALARFRTAHAGQTVEAWILPDGTWEIHLDSEHSVGNRLRWYLRAPDPETAPDRIRRCLEEHCRFSSLRFFVQGERFFIDPAPTGSVFHVEGTTAASRFRLHLISGSAGELSLYHRGFLLQKGPCPIAHLDFSWDCGPGPDFGDAAAAVTRDFAVARRLLEDSLLSALATKATPASCWPLFLAGHPAPEILDRTIGQDLLGHPFSTMDLLEKIVLPVSPVSTLPPVDSRVLLLDGNLWSADLLSRIRQVLEFCANDFEAGRNSILAARRIKLAPEGSFVLWPRLWERLASREPRLAFRGGLVLAELHHPVTQAWPFFPVEGSVELARLQALPPTPWDLNDALWLAVNHPLVERLAEIAEPADAVWILARLVLLSQDLEPDDNALP